MSLAFLEYTPILDLAPGPLTVSPHGVGTAVGVLAGAWLLLPAARARGIDDAVVYRMLTRAIVAALIGARFAYVVNHLGDYTDRPWEALRVWEGGASLLGDLVVADHLGTPTDFPLDYRCSTADTASPCVAPIGQAVHQPALYDFVSVLVLLGVLLWIRRRPLRSGSLFLLFVAWYGTGRVVADFFRIDETHGLGLTLSQWFALGAVLAALTLLLQPRRGRPEAAAVADRTQVDDNGRASTRPSRSSA